jgi:hypothetical protein
VKDVGIRRGWFDGTDAVLTAEELEALEIGNIPAEAEERVPAGQLVHVELDLDGFGRSVPDRP